MNVSLTPELKQFVEKEVATGMYQTASEVVRAGLRRLRDEQQFRVLKTPATLADLEADLLRAADSIDSGRGVPAGEVFARLSARAKARRRHG